MSQQDDQSIKNVEEPMSLEELFGEPTHTYTRAEALADGLLVDVSAIARQAGFIRPVALTAAVWSQYVAVPEGVVCQDETGRLWDILWIARIVASRTEGSVAQFGVYVRNDNRTPKLVMLKLVLGPGDDPSPVFTILLPEED